VTTWSDAHRSAAVLAAELHADLDTPLDRPVDVFGAIERLGLVLAFGQLGKVSGFYLPESPSAGILLHAGHPRTRQRYTAGHELGHHVFEHSAEVDGDLEEALRRDASEWPDHEKEAEAFGAWFLMPLDLLREGLAQLRIPSVRNEYDVYALSLWLGTSYTATVRQLSVTRIIRRDQADEWARIAPRTIKRSLAGELVPDDLRNDVWWRDEKHQARELEVRPGDRIVVSLSEIPTTGYSWRFVDVPEDVNVLADSYDEGWEGPVFVGSLGDEPNLAGQDHPRSFVIEVDPTAEPSERRITWVKERSWREGEPMSSYDLTLSIQTSLHGLQLSETELALTA
jgi:Zn-dependent peptidase ImmA (M78 family)